jgi:hypothetical protein
LKLTKLLQLLKLDLALQKPYGSLKFQPMSKRPTPKKKRAKRATRLQHSAYLAQEVTRLKKRQNSPYAGPAEPKNKGDKALEGITRIKA